MKDDSSEKSWTSIFEETSPLGIEWKKVCYDEQPPLTAIQLHCDNCRQSFFVTVETSDVDEFRASKFMICPICGYVNKREVL